MRIPDKYKDGDGIYKTVLKEPYHYKKKTAKTTKPKTIYRAVFALWNGEDWCSASGQPMAKRFNDPKPASKWIEERLRQHEREGTAVMTARDGFREFVTKHYLPVLKKKELETFGREEQKLETLVEYYGDTPLKEIDYLKVNEFSDWFKDQPIRYERKGETIEKVRSGATVNRYLERLRHCLNVALKAGKIKAVPSFEDAWWPTNGSTATISREEFKRMLAACNITPQGATENRSRWRLVLIAAYTMGCRVGELWNIHKRDITSLDKVNRVGVITIAKNKVKRNKKGEKKIEYKKLEISTWLYDEMEAAGAFKKADDERLFMWTKEYRRVIKTGKFSLMKLAKVNPKATFHTLRSASATNRDLYQDFEAVQQVIGHKTKKVTDSYIRPDDKQTLEKHKGYNAFLQEFRQGENDDVLNAETLD
jgi:integrase